MKKLDYALRLAEKGFHVFPVKENAKFPPLIDDFPNKATRDKKQITKWFSNGHSNANIGISTSRYKESEALIVVDVDNKEGKMGESELLKLELEGLDCPVTLEQKSANGGRHIIYRVDQAVGQHKLSPSIDIRSKGGYILGEGSTLDGKGYKLGKFEAAKATTSLISRCGKSLTKKQAAKLLESLPTAKDRAEHYLTTEAPIGIKGQGSDQTTFIVAAKCKDFGLSEQETYDLMSELWNPRCLPDEIDLGDLRYKVENAFKYGVNEPGASSPEMDFTAIPDEEKTPHKRRVKYLHEVKPKLKQMYLVNKLLSPGAMSVVYGESNGGKTFFSLNLALHISLGQIWHDRATMPGAVIYVAAEGGFGVQKRIDAFRKYHKIEDRRDIPFALLDDSIDLKKDVSKLLADIKQTEKDFNTKAVLVVVDTLARTLGDGNENAAEDMGAFIAAVDKVRKQSNAHVMVIHHTGKDTSKGARGHSSLRGATDTEILIEDNVAKIRKQRDMEFGSNIGFRLQEVVIGEDEGKPVTSCVVLPANTSAAQDFSKKPLDPETLPAKAFQALNNVLEWAPHPAPDSLDLNEDSMVAKIEDWREEFFALAYPDSEEKQYKSFKRMANQLVSLKYIEKNETYAWLPL